MQSFNETTLSDIQKEYFEAMSEEQRELIRKGAPFAFVSLETGEKIYSFNTENYQPPEGALEMLGKRLVKLFLRFFGHCGCFFAVL